MVGGRCWYLISYWYLPPLPQSAWEQFYYESSERTRALQSTLLGYTQSDLPASQGQDWGLMNWWLISTINMISTTTWPDINLSVISLLSFLVNISNWLTQHHHPPPTTRYRTYLLLPPNTSTKQTRIKSRLIVGFYCIKLVLLPFISNLNIR